MREASTIFTLWYKLDRQTSIPRRGLTQVEMISPCRGLRPVANTKQNGTGCSIERVLCLFFLPPGLLSAFFLLAPKQVGNAWSSACLGQSHTRFLMAFVYCKVINGSCKVATKFSIHTEEGLSHKGKNVDLPKIRKGMNLRDCTLSKPRPHSHCGWTGEGGSGSLPWMDTMYSAPEWGERCGQGPLTRHGCG